MLNRMKKYEERYVNLNDEQRRAVDSIDGPLMIIAGPGSGKTELLSMRTANILKQTQVSPQNILLLTFTDSASFNMRKRLVEIIGEDGYRVSIYTFHSFATDIINRYSEYFFDDAKFIPATSVDKIKIMQDILQNLKKDDALNKFHPEKGYIYLQSIISCISDMKKGNFTPEVFQEKIENNKAEYKEIEKCISVLNHTKGNQKLEKVLPFYAKFYNDLKSLENNEIAKILLSHLALAMHIANEANKPNELTSFRNKFFTKSDHDEFVLDDASEGNINKMNSLVNIYEKYQQSLYEKGLYDFEDMLLLAINAIKNNENLKYDLQEKYQYIMIDEFQDTNDAQFAFVKALTESVDSPNVMAVGDDDQAIFKFQGAEISNIFEFAKSFQNIKTIVLDKNYRSTQVVLDKARQVILKAKDRLEVRDKTINKSIKADNKKLLETYSAVSEIIEKDFENEYSEYEYIAKEIKKLIESNINPSEIAVICRKHKSLIELSKTMSEYKLPIAYEKKENVLEKSHIIELIKILQYIGSDISREDLLVDILSFKFWNLENIEIWKIAESVRKGKVEIDQYENEVYIKSSWLENMLKSENEKIKQIAEFLINLKIEAKSTPIEYMLDKIIGTTEFLWSDNDYDDGENIDNVKENSEDIKESKDKGDKYVSPYKEYYFNNLNFERNKPEYLNFLFCLRTFVGALREYHGENVLYAKDIESFTNVYNKENGLELTLVSPFASSERAVQLLTAHRAKGLEFEYVFLLSVDESVWKRAGFSRNISFPLNINLTIDSDGDDDKIRLLYVALTRAKHTIYITNSNQKLSYLINDIDASNEEEGSKQDEKNKKSAKNIENKEINNEVSIEILNTFAISNKREFIADERVLLMRLLENYKMPVTHLNNFLNFTKVGPMKFIEQNLLRFPQAMSSSAAYGSAVHEALERCVIYFNKYNKFPENKYIINLFVNKLSSYNLPNIEYEKYKESGEEKLEIYLDNLKSRIVKSKSKYKVEIKFASEGVLIGTARVTGNIDRIEMINDKQIIVTDLKTGKTQNSFEPKSADNYEKIKLHFYKYQLYFYKFLIENSRSYKNNIVISGEIEFIEADTSKNINIINLEYEEIETERFSKLINIVFEKIMNLDFPDTNKYPETLKGVVQFEEDLLNGNI